MLGSLFCLLPAPCMIQKQVWCGQGASGGPRPCSCSGPGRSALRVVAESREMCLWVQSLDQPGLPWIRPPTPRRSPPCWAPGLIQLSGPTVVHSPTQHSRAGAGARPAPAFVLCGQDGAGRRVAVPEEALGIGDGHQVGALGLSIAPVTGAAHLLQVPPPHPPVVKALVQLCEPLDTVGQQPQPRPLCRQLWHSDLVSSPATCGQNETTAVLGASLLSPCCSSPACPAVAARWKSRTAGNVPSSRDRCWEAGGAESWCLNRVIP